MRFYVMITAAALIAIAAICAGCAASAAHAAACTAPDAANGTTVTVDAHGNASSPWTGGTGFRCSDGTWTRIG